MKLKDEGKTELIYAAACRLVGRAGIAGLTMATIAREAGLATGTLYTYFPNKEALLRALYRHAKLRTTKALFRDFNEQEPLRLALQKIWLNYLRTRLDSYDESVFVEQYYTSPYMQADEVQMSLDTMAPLFRLFDRGKKGLLLKDLDNTLLAIYLMGPLRELAGLIRLQGGTVPSPLADAAFSLCWDGIRS
ncbi:TetR/AcrR family transcriptional regulator [Hymenobacter sp. BT664]|uniref:TetR/AcrR family transcriptional regulator n=1 Tax=Hymenobacter montanus TaxID=2771359 RepID=A0A927BFD7_9BACT|nr:TetR/AcrR family transcriptional regulator [Hymenobacter montanus]MBD2769007.1 TetR/AcrR family transcriptional regulator [Hymenobacter montanus]